MWFGDGRQCSTTIWFIIAAFIMTLRPVAGLTCMTCMYTSSTTQLDNFRVATRLAKPQCVMEPIKCDRDQDVCVTITMHIGGGDYWMGAGCDRRINFQHMSCQNVRTMSRNVQLGSPVRITHNGFPCRLRPRATITSTCVRVRT